MINDSNEFTLCKMPSQGPNFSLVPPVGVSPRASPYLCLECKTAYDELNPKKVDKKEERKSVKKVDKVTKKPTEKTD